MSFRPIGLVVFATMLGTFAAQAHHSLTAKYNPRQTLTLDGTVTRVDWSNPHVRVYMDVPGTGTSSVEWELEMGSPNEQLRGGWKIDAIKQGDHIKASIYRARDGSNVGFARSIVVNH